MPKVRCCLGARAVAARIGRAPSTVSRELRVRRFGVEVLPEFPDKGAVGSGSGRGFATRSAYAVPGAPGRSGLPTRRPVAGPQTPLAQPVGELVDPGVGVVSYRVRI